MSAASEPAACAWNADAEYVCYTIRPGDTLWSIARDRLGSGTRYKEIIALNGLRSNRLRVGETLWLPE